MSIDYRGNPWDVSVDCWASSCSVITTGMYDDSCVNTPSRCEASCAAFDSTFPTTPAGYSIANPSGTTASGLGVRRCAAGYCGVAEVTCGRAAGPEGSGCAGVDTSGSDATADETSCNNAGACTYTAANPGADPPVTESCVATTAFDAPSGCTEASCTAFSTTFPTMAGYTVANPAGTTTAGLGSVSCAFGYIGAATIECPCSGTFSAPTGCRRQTCGDVGCTDAGDSYATSNVNQATANAHYGIIESYNTLMNPGESASIFVVNTFVTPGSFVAVTMVTTGSLPYEMVTARGDASGGMMIITVENLDPTSSMIG